MISMSMPKLFPHDMYSHIIFIIHIPIMYIYTIYYVQIMCDFNIFCYVFYHFQKSKKTVYIIIISQYTMTYDKSKKKKKRNRVFITRTLYCNIQIYIYNIRIKCLSVFTYNTVFRLSLICVPKKNPFLMCVKRFFYLKF